MNSAILFNTDSKCLRTISLGAKTCHNGQTLKTPMFSDITIDNGYLFITSFNNGVCGFGLRGWVCVRGRGSVCAVCVFLSS